MDTTSCRVEAFPLLSPARPPDLALALSHTLARGVPLAPGSSGVHPPCTAHGKWFLPLGVPTGPVWVGACCSDGAALDSLAPEGCVACEPAASGVSPQRV